MGYQEDPDGPLVMSRNHRGMSIRSFQSRMKFWGKEAKLAVPASPHWLRHTLAKRVQAQSTAYNPLNIIKNLLGHADLGSTGIYTEPSREEEAAAIEEAI